MTKDELNLTLEALEKYANAFGASDLSVKAMYVVRQALAQPEPWEKFCDSNCVWTDHHPDCKLAQRLPLTDEEIYDMYNEPRSDAEMIAFARAIEAAHGIKGEA